MSDLKFQAWGLLLVTAVLFGVWQRSISAAGFFVVLVLLVGTVITGWTKWLVKDLLKRP
jgi:hypothetical protein